VSGRGGNGTSAGSSVLMAVKGKREAERAGAGGYAVGWEGCV
jgi:hypothetical protein